MHDLRLVGVHEDGEHLLLTDADGQRFSLPVDEALRAAVRRDRAHLGQLQIEIEGGLRPRDVQARIRAGASAEEVAAVAGWTVEKVRRYEGPVLAERAHVADLARTVRVRQRGTEPVTLGALVARRLAGRGVDPERVGWDAWRADSGPWTVVAGFVAGGREREARWHLDLAAMSVVAADDEARWLSEDDAPAQGPLASGRLQAVRDGEGRIGSGATTVYDIEADGGVGAEPRREVDVDPLDLVSAMRSRRRGTAVRRHDTSGGSQPSDVPGSAHPAGRRRVRPEPLELDPTLMDDPPAAHPPASEVEPRQPAARHWPLAESMRRPAEPAEPAEPQPDADREPAAGPAETVVDLSAQDEPEPAAGPAAEPQTRRSQASGRRGRRSSVPSWDDIVFGAKKD